MSKSVPMECHKVPAESSLLLGVGCKDIELSRCMKLFAMMFFKGILGREL